MDRFQPGRQILVVDRHDVQFVAFTRDFGGAAVPLSQRSTQGQHALPDKILQAVQGAKPPEHLVVIINHHIVECHAAVVVGTVALPEFGRGDLEVAGTQALVAIIDWPGSMADEDDGIALRVRRATRAEQGRIRGGVQEDGVEVALLEIGRLFGGRHPSRRQDLERKVGLG